MTKYTYVAMKVLDAAAILPGEHMVAWYMQESSARRGERDLNNQQSRWESLVHTQIAKLKLRASEIEWCVVRRSIDAAETPKHTRFLMMTIHEARERGVKFILLRENSEQAFETAKRLNALPLDGLGTPIWDRRYTWEGTSRPHREVQSWVVADLGPAPYVVGADYGKHVAVVDSYHIPSKERIRGAFHALGMISRACMLAMISKDMDHSSGLRDLSRDLKAILCKAHHGLLTGNTVEAFKLLILWRPMTGGACNQIECEKLYADARRSRLRELVAASDEKRRIKVYCQGEED